MAHGGADEIIFRWRGQQRRLSRQQVIDALREQTPEPTNTWLVEVEDRRFPVKQAWACATGTPQQEARLDLVNPWLERLGFRLMHPRPRPGRPLVQQPPVCPPTAPPPRAGDRPMLERRNDVMDHRIAALAAAVQFINGCPDATVAEVLEAATAFETWLTR